MASPLSNFDDEVIADSENEDLQPINRNGYTVDNNTPPRNDLPETTALPNPLSYAKSRNSAHITRQDSPDIDAPLVHAMEPQINYFAGFEGDEPPVPSIAERAKMRQRKPVNRPGTAIFELTDEEESSPGPLTMKAKAKARKSGNATGVPALIPESARNTNPGQMILPQTDIFNSPPLVNAKLKIRPKPAKKTRIQPLSPVQATSQSTLPVLTSPYPQSRDLQPTTSEQTHFGPFSTSSVAPDKDTRLPPIAFLPQPSATDSDAPPSSLPSIDGDVVYVPRKKNAKTSTLREPVDELVDEDDPMPPPPPTFFAGSSSSLFDDTFAVPATIIEASHVEVVDLTELPPTMIEPSAAASGTVSPNKKPKKPKKPRKKKNSDNTAQDDTSRTINKQEKGKDKGMEVEVLVPPRRIRGSRKASLKGKGKGNADLNPSDVDEDELNIGGSPSGPVAVSTFTSSLPPTECPPKSKPVLENDDKIQDSDFAKRNKREGKKRKSDSTRSDSLRNGTPSLKRKKEYHSEGRSNKSQDEEPSTTESSTKATLTKEIWNESEDRPAKSHRSTMLRRENAITPREDDTPHASNEDLPGNLRDCEGTHKVETDRALEPDQDDISDHCQARGESKDVRNILSEIQPANPASSPALSGTEIPKRRETPDVSKYPSISSKYTIAPRTQTPSMTELIRRVNSHPSSPFPRDAGRGSTHGLAYSPYLKSSRRTLSRIAPLHPNRRTPPPPPPPPLPKKKSKKELEMEEKWEEEIIEELGGISEWLALSESEKRELKRAKRDREMGYCED